ncbi:hypothetical protein AMECASPLE_032166 [Ameca splendens]|uniref:Uncharacterized protein n=1 Tax=Ameca splendens TaxID=208324 RepID=A0ABV0XJL7_9TELE
MVGPRVCAQFGLLIPVYISSSPPGVPPVMFWSRRWASPITELARGEKPHRQLQSITAGPPGPGRAWVTPTRMSRPNWAQTLGPTMDPLDPSRSQSRSHACGPQEGDRRGEGPRNESLAAPAATGRRGALWRPASRCRVLEAWAVCSKASSAAELKSSPGTTGRALSVP